MLRLILIAVAAVGLLAAPIADAQTCQPGDPCWGQQVGGLVMITDAPVAAPRKVVVKQPRRVVYQAAPVYVSAGSYGASGASSYGSSGTYRTTTTVTTSSSYGSTGAYKQPVEVKTRRGLFGRRTITTYRYAQ